MPKRRKAPGALLSVKEVAEMTGVHTNTVLRWLQKYDGGGPRLKAINVSNGKKPSWRIDPRVLDDFLRTRAK